MDQSVCFREARITLTPVKEEAIDLEGRLRDGGIAVLMVSDSGVARLKDVVGKTTND